MVELINMKRCNKCGVEKPATTEWFRQDRYKGDGFVGRCKQCLKEYEISHREQIKMRKARHYAANRERITGVIRAYRIKARAKRRAYNAQYRIAHREQVRERSNRWWAANPEKRIVSSAKRRARIQNHPDTFTADEYGRMMNYWNYCCAYCGAQRDFWHVMQADHFIAITSLHSPGTVALNMIPACKSCNSSKNDSDPAEWLNGKFGKRKAKQILSKINEYFKWVSQQD